MLHSEDFSHAVRPGMLADSANQTLKAVPVVDVVHYSGCGELCCASGGGSDAEDTRSYTARACRRPGVLQFCLSVLILLCGTAITLGLFFQDIQQQTRAHTDVFTSSSTELAEFIRRLFIIPAMAFSQMSVAINELGPQALTPKSFRSQGAQVFRLNPVFSNLFFVRKLLAAERAEWEQRMSAAYGMFVSVRDVSTYGVSSPRPVYWPIELSATPLRTTSFLGADYGSEEARALALARAESGFPSISAPVFSKGINMSVVILFRPVMTDMFANTSIAAPNIATEVSPSGMLTNVTALSSGRLPVDVQPSAWNTSHVYGMLVGAYNATGFYNNIMTAIAGTVQGIGAVGSTNGFLQGKLSVMQLSDVTGLLSAGLVHNIPSTLTAGVVPIDTECVPKNGTWFVGGVLAQAGDERILGSALTYPVGYNGLTFAALGELPYARLQEARASGDAVVASYLIGNAGRTLALTVASTHSYLKDELAPEWRILAAGICLTSALAVLVHLAVGVSLRQQRRKREAQTQEIHKMQAARDAQDEMLALLSHEIRNPAHIISQSCAFLSEHVTPAHPARPDLDAIQLSAETMHRLINDVINFSALRKGALDVRLQIFELRPLLLAVAKAHAPLAEVPLRVSIADDLPRLIIADPMRLQQVISNGLTNACKFCRSGSITVCATASATSVSGDKPDALSGLEQTVCITVRDTGPGPAETPSELSRGGASPAEQHMRSLEGTGIAPTCGPCGTLCCRPSAGACTGALAQGYHHPSSPPLPLTRHESVILGLPELPPGDLNSTNTPRNTNTPAAAGGSGTSGPIGSGTLTPPTPTHNPTHNTSNSNSGRGNWHTSTRSEGAGAQPQLPVPTTLPTTTATSVSASYAAKIRGSGLGLPVARMLAARMGGDMQLLRDHVTHETVFQITLPLLPVELQREIREAAATPVGHDGTSTGAAGTSALRRRVQHLLKPFSPDTAADGLSRATYGHDLAMWIGNHMHAQPQSHLRSVDKPLSENDRRGFSHAANVVGGGTVGSGSEGGSGDMHAGVHSREHSIVVVSAHNPLAPGGTVLSPGTGATPSGRNAAFGGAVTTTTTTTSTSPRACANPATTATASPADTAARTTAVVAAAGTISGSGSALGTAAGLRVLVADDEKLNRDIMVRLLKRLGCDVIAVEDGPEVLDLCAAQTHSPPFDLILLDISMKVSDGRDVCRQLRKRYGTALRIFAATGNRPDATYAQFDGILEKPFKQADLSGIVQRCAAGRASQVGDASAATLTE